MTESLGRPGVVAITLDERGGGIAAASRLVREVLDDVSGRPCPAWLLAGEPTRRGFSTGALRRASFGARVVGAQLTAACDWLFYTHLNLASVQRGLPRPFRLPYAVLLHDV